MTYALSTLVTILHNFLGIQFNYMTELKEGSFQLMEVKRMKGAHLFKGLGGFLVSSELQ